MPIHSTEGYDTLTWVVIILGLVVMSSVVWLRLCFPTLTADGNIAIPFSGLGQAVEITPVMGAVYLMVGFVLVVIGCSGLPDSAN
ncbi:MAG: hypothetical protein PHR51_00260 [Patescibacteria group bacterium]|nr:hypothetical protein [Patescibacteria group bacterium]